MKDDRINLAQFKGLLGIHSILVPKELFVGVGYAKLGSPRPPQAQYTCTAHLEGNIVIVYDFPHYEQMLRAHGRLHKFLWPEDLAELPIEKYLRELEKRNFD